MSDEIIKHGQGANLMPSENEWRQMTHQAEFMVRSGLLPKSVNSVEKAVTIMLMARELGMQPMQAFSEINVIQGKPTLSATGMLAQILKVHPATTVEYLQNDNDACRIRVTKRGQKPSEFGFSVEDARQAGLFSNPTWKKYTRAMLRSRAISEMARSMFPDALMGFRYTPEDFNHHEGPPMPVSQQAVEMLPPASTPPAEPRDDVLRMVEAFAAYDVTADELARLAKKSLAEFTDQDVAEARSLFSEMKDGSVKKSDINFPPADVSESKQIENLF